MHIHRSAHPAPAIRYWPQLSNDSFLAALPAIELAAAARCLLSSLPRATMVAAASAEVHAQREPTERKNEYQAYN
jgi:hypothetical protein